jgi:hypothetical protein
MNASQGLIACAPTGAVYADEEEETCGRMLSNEEFLAAIRSRTDIFAIEKGSRLSRIEALFLCLAIAVGLIFATVKVVRVPIDFTDPFQLLLPAHVFVAPNPLTIRQNRYQTVPQVPDARQTLKPSRYASSQSKSGSGVGSPTSRIARMRAFTMVGKYLSGSKNGGTPEATSLTGIQSGIDMVISGVNTLIHGGSMSAGRTTGKYIGTDEGIGHSGFHRGNGDDLGDPLEGLLGPQAAQLEMRPMSHDLGIDNIGRGATTIRSGSIIGGRSKTSIMHTVMDNLPSLRYAYNRWLRSHPGNTGKITVRFAIDEFGTVIFCEVVGATIGAPDLSQQIVSMVRTWNFGKIDKPGDITEAVYPLVFSL